MFAQAEQSTAANRGGQMTDEQQRRLAAAVRAETSQGLIGAGSAAAFFLIFTLVAFNDPHVPLPGHLFFGGLLLLSLLIMGALFWRRARLLAEVQAGHLERATGHVGWKSGRYRAQVPGRSLDLTAFNLAAGSYDFSYLPVTGRVVAAELAAADTPTQAEGELRHALAVANHFNLDDLPAYRDGRLGLAGPPRLRRTWTPAAAMLLLALVLFALFAALVSGHTSKDLVPIVFVAAVLLGIAGLFTALGALSATFDLLGGQVASAAGAVHKSMRQTYGRNASTYYYYKLDALVWTVTPEAYRALIEGPAYRVYYLPRSKMLLGIEPL